MEYEISIPSYSFVEYREGSKVLKVDVDLRDPDLLLSDRGIGAWEPPDNDDPIDEDKKREIIKRVARYLHRERGWKVTIDWGRGGAPSFWERLSK